MRHGSRIDPPSRFDKHVRVRDLEQVLGDDEYTSSLDERPIEYISDTTQSIVSENNSPDLPFRYSINPYRGCAHGCSYCYARNSHEYLGFNAGLDFETKIVVKHNAAELLRDFLARETWRAEPITFSGVTDCYQPGEREFQLTRGCLAVALEARQPVSIVTKNALVVRDLDLLAELAALRLAHVFVSINSLDGMLAREMEPRTSIPAARLRAVRALADAGVPVGVMVAPVIPGLNESEMPRVLAAAKEAGAQSAAYVLLRLPMTVEPVFREWLERKQPLKASRVLQRIRATRGGKLSNSTFGERMRGSGDAAEQIRSLFRLFARKHGLDRRLPPLDASQFRRPATTLGQQWLF